MRTIINYKAVAFFTGLLMLVTFAGCGNNTTNVDMGSKKSDVIDSNDNSSNESEAESEKKDIIERVDLSNVAVADAGDFEYTETKLYSSPVNGTSQTCIFIKDYKGSSDVVVVPDTINDYPVVSVDLSGTEEKPRENISAIKIPDSAYVVKMDYCNNLSTVELPKEIADSNYMLCFSNCPNLTYINVPYGVNSVGPGNFTFDVSYCESLLSLELPDSVTSMTQGAFAACTNLESIILSDNITRISQGAFSGCKSLKDINIPKSCTNIERISLRCPALESITIPASVTTIGQDAFSGSGLKTVIIEDGDEELTLVTGCFFGTSLEYIELPDRATDIQDDVFFEHQDATENAQLVIKCSKGSVAEQYAKDKGFTCRTD